MTKQLHLFALALAAALCAIGSAHAAILVNDTWIDDTDSDPASPVYSEYGVDADLDGNLESAWFQGGVGTLDPNPAAGAGPLVMDLTGTGGSSASWTTYFTPDATSVNLANSGDRLRVTWVFTPTNVNTSNTSQNFRFGVVDAGTRSTTNDSLPSTTYAGYAVWGNMGQTLGNSNPFQLRGRTAGSGNFLNTTGDFGEILANGATSGNTGYASGTEYTMVWEMVRNGTSLDLDVSMRGGQLDGDGLAQVTFTDATPNSFTFDTFGIRPSGESSTASVFNTSLFRVEFIPIPEPTTAGLTIAALGALGVLRRR